MSVVDACLMRSRGAFGEPVVRLGMPLVDDYLEFLQGRCRPNTVLAAAYDLRVFFRVVDKPPAAVRPADVLAFITAQRTGRAGGQLVQPVDPSGEPGGLAASTVARRLSIVSGFFAYLQARGDVPTNPLPGGLPTRRERAMVAAMVLGGLRRCEVLGLRMEDLRVPERRVFIAEGKGGHQRLVPVSARFFAAVAAYLDTERPAGADTDRVFVVLKGPNRGQPLSAKGVDEVLAARGAAPGWPTPPVTSCGTPASPGCGRPGWRWRRCR